MLRLMCTLGLCLFAAGGIVAQDDASKADLKKLQGKWKTVIIIQDGMKEEIDKSPVWIIEDNVVTYDGTKTEDEIKLDASKKLKEMNIRSFRSATEVKDFKAIYKLEADVLTICVDVVTKVRPQEFASGPASGHRLLVLQRIKEKKKEQE